MKKDSRWFALVRGEEIFAVAGSPGEIPGIVFVEIGEAQAEALHYGRLPYVDRIDIIARAKLRSGGDGWRYAYKDRHDKWWPIEDETGQEVARLNMDDVNEYRQLANGRLILAAPDMASALEEMSGDPGFRDTPWFAIAQEALRRAGR